MALAAASQCELSRVLLIPAANPPHRRQGPYASYEDRYRMVELACAGSPLLIPSRLDEGPGKSYSVNMAERFLQTETNASVYFIIGADAFAEITSWNRWRDLAKLVTFAVIARPRAEYQIPPETKVVPVNGVNLAISSSEIRERLAAGDANLDLPASVFTYIRQHHLFQHPGNTPA
jgi:nicotinate-nucleotide adenylyltransferase